MKGNLDPLSQYVDEFAYKNLDYKMEQHASESASDDVQVGKLLKMQ